MFEPLIATSLPLLLILYCYCCLAALWRGAFSAEQLLFKHFEQSRVTKQRSTGNKIDGVREINVIKRRGSRSKGRVNRHCGNKRTEEEREHSERILGRKVREGEEVKWSSCICNMQLNLKNSIVISCEPSCWGTVARKRLQL